MKFLFKDVQIEIKKADITEERAEAIVNPANTDMLMERGVAGAIKKKGGDEIEEEALKHAPLDMGGVAVTSSGKLPASYVFHAAVMGKDSGITEVVIRKAARNVLLKAKEKNVSSLAIPALGCGLGGFSFEVSSKIMAQEIFKFVHFDTPGSVEKITFALFSDEAVEAFESNVKNYIEYIYQKIQKGPFITVDGIIPMGDGIILIERSNPPSGWALPGGFVDWGETVEEAVKREVKEETNIDTGKLEFFGVYSSADRDPRFHTVSCVYIIEPKNKDFKASSDAKNIALYSKEQLKSIKIAFDHREIIEKFFEKR